MSFLVWIAFDFILDFGKLMGGICIKDISNQGCKYMKERKVLLGKTAPAVNEL